MFKKKTVSAPINQLTKLVGLLQNNLNTSQVVTPAIARSALSLESLRDDQMHSLNMAGNEISVALEAIASELGIEKRLTQAQIDAGTIAGVLAGDYKSFLGHKHEFPSISTEGMSVVQANGLSDAMANRSFAMEAYDERENRNAVVYSIAYNMQSARQDEFGETFFPTLVVTPDNVGFGITVNLMMVYDGIERKITGSFEDFKKKNIIRAVVDASILKKEQTKVVPVHRAQSADKFVLPAVVPPYSIMLEGEAITTAPIAMGKKVDLIGLSQTDTLLAAGIMDMTDTLDPYVTLQNLYAVVGTDILKFNVTNLPLSNFTYSTQNNYRVETLNFTTTSILLNKFTTRVDGTALTTLSDIVTSDLIVRLEVNATGTTNIETGETTVYGNSISVYSVQDSSGNMLDLTAAPAAAIVAAFSTGILAGYDMIAYRTNMNRRQRGQLIDVTKFTQLYNVPLRSPITTIHPINTDGQTDASDVQALITATRIRTSNEAVSALLNASTLLRDYVDSRDAVGAGPDILGVGRFFVRPTYFEETMDMNVVVDSLKSHERAADIQAALVNKIRDLAFRMYRDSEYKAAADALNGGISPTPVVIIGTDPVISRYLTVTGDLRTLGGEFDIRIVSTLDSRISGKIFIAFGIFDEQRNVAPNPLNFGNMVWAPELVLTANISRAGTISKETVVQPRFIMLTHCPIMSVLEVENIPDVLNKVALHAKAV
jgi:hypothetical protein